MKVPEAARKIIKDAEGLKLEAYLCPANVWTIGYGHTKGVKKGDKINIAQAEALFEEDIESHAAPIRKAITVATTDNQFGAIVSLAFNVGVGNVQSSTLLRKHNRKDYYGAMEEFKRWNKSGGKVLRGLVIRRDKEANLYGTS